MAQVVQIQQCRAEYSENLLPIMEDRTLTITSGMANGAVNYNTNFHFDEGSSIKMDITSSGLNKFINFNLSDYSVTAPKTANYIFSYRLKKVNPTDSIDFAVEIFVNGILSTDTTYDNNLDVNGDWTNLYWNTFAQSISLNAGDVLTFRFIMNTDLLITSLYLDGLKLELDDRFLGIPSIYSKPKDYDVSETKGYVNRSDIGWASYVDTLHTSGSPQSITEGVTPILLTNNSGTTILTQLPDGVTNLFNQASTKITPVQENDYNSVDIMFKVKNSVTNGFFTIYIDIPTLGTRFEQTFSCPKTAGVEMGVNYAFHHYVSSEFATNGGIIYIVANSGNLQIYDKQYRFSKLINAK